MLTRHFVRLVALLAIVVLLVLAGASATALAATDQGPDFAPDVRPAQLHLNKVERGMSTVIHWKGPNRYRTLMTVDLDPVDDRSVSDFVGSTWFYGTGLPRSVRNMQISTNIAQVTPDGWSSFDADLMMYAWPFIARARSGSATLTEVTVGGRTLLQGTQALAANHCAALRAGTRTVQFDPRTLVPVRIVDRRGSTIEFSSTISSRIPRLTDFAPLTVIGRRTFRNERYTKQTLAQANATATWPISLPTALPPGFTLATLGTAPLGNYLGPEGSFPRSRGVFFAKWSLGLESIDLTIRPARSTLTRDWDESDPFGGECASAVTTEVMVGSATAKYAQGENGSPRLWWRNGTTLYTLSGPFSAEQLATIARSLTVVTA